MFKFVDVGAQHISLTRFLYTNREFKQSFVRSHIHTHFGEVSQIEAAKYESGLMTIFETPTLGKLVSG